MSQELHSTLEYILGQLPACAAVVSPGSRNAAVVEALIAQGYELYSAVDERSAAFQALGMAKATKAPVVLSCTSGTAALNYYPAIAEAFYARVPLIILTADRPIEMIDQWEGQSIRQKAIFDQHVRKSFQADLAQLSEIENMMAEVSRILCEEILGPIHINIPIAEPFYTRDVLQSGSARPLIPLIHDETLYIEDYISVKPQDKILVLHGMNDNSMPRVEFRDQKLVQEVVILADVCSLRNSNVSHWDAILSTTPVDQLNILKADVLISTGTFSMSKALKQFLKSTQPPEHYHFGDANETGNPFGTLTQVIEREAEKRESPWELKTEYLTNWKSFELQMLKKFNALNWNSWSEMAACRQLFSKLPARTALHLSNSMPIRYASLLRDSIQSNQFYCNRGTSGIDGCSSTALGYALASKDNSLLISGDVAFFYDINAWYRDQLPANLKVVLLNNRGGRIFEFIEGPSLLKVRLDFQLTSHQRTAESLCTHFGLEYFCADNFDSLESVWENFMGAKTVALLELQTDPQLNKEFYQRFKNLVNE